MDLLNRFWTVARRSLTRCARSCWPTPRTTGTACSTTTRRTRRGPRWTTARAWIPHHTVFYEFYLLISLIWSRMSFTTSSVDMFSLMLMLWALSSSSPAGSYISYILVPISTDFFPFSPPPERTSSLFLMQLLVRFRTMNTKSWPRMLLHRSRLFLFCRNYIMYFPVGFITF